MKTNKILAFVLGAIVAVSCADFEEINYNPKAVNAEDAKPYYALNKSIVADQQNPNDAERVFVLYWADLARQDGEGGGRSVGGSNDEWAGCLYNLTKNTVTSATTAINLVDYQIEKKLVGESEAKFYGNVKAAARIWRVYLLSEFVDSFGSFTTDFEAETPEYKSVQDCYKFMFTELKEAVASIDLNVTASTDLERNGDPAYKFDPLKWKNFGISMWMRLAMRMSNANVADAELSGKTQFAAAYAAGTGIVTTDGTFRVKEDGGWNDLSGVMSRTWNWQELSATMANLTTNFGGTPVRSTLLNTTRIYNNTININKGIGWTINRQKDSVEKYYAPYIKDAKDYLGVHMVDSDGKLYEEYSDNPTKGYFFDGLPSHVDPRAMVYYCLPGDYDNHPETGYDAFMRVSSPEELVIELSAKDKFAVNTTYAFNGLPCGFSYDEKMYGKNQLVYPNYGTTYPALQERYRNCSEYRVFFGPWETFFLIAEAMVRGWIPGGEDAQMAQYYAGINASFEYLGIGDLFEEYISGEDAKRYNRVGTSVAYDHTDEPDVNGPVKVKVLNPLTGNTEEVVYNWPDKTKILYDGQKLNDHLTKIITQKYIANTPWLPLENWSDHRRTGLPFWEIPVSSNEFSYLDGWTKESYKAGQKVGFYAQRMNYPAKFNNASPEQYKNAIQHMGMTASGENTITPLFWAKGAKQN